MSKIRCVFCGSSQWDAHGYKCGRCGGVMGMRTETCYVNNETKNKLLGHTRELAEFGIEIEQPESLQKNWGDAIAVAGVAIACADSLDHGVLHKLILYLRDTLLVPADEILRLRLDEPEKILRYCGMDKKPSTDSDSNAPHTTGHRQSAHGPDRPRKPAIVGYGRGKSPGSRGVPSASGGGKKRKKNVRKHGRKKR